MPSHYLNQCMLGYCQLDIEEQFSLKKMHLTISCAIRRSFCPEKWVDLDIDYLLDSHVISLLEHGWFKGSCVPFIRFSWNMTWCLTSIAGKDTVLRFILFMLQYHVKSSLIYNIECYLECYRCNVAYHYHLWPFIPFSHILCSRNSMYNIYT